jgi:isopropylmalate/homocitrate/citramalate synthase
LNSPEIRTLRLATCRRLRRRFIADAIEARFATGRNGEAKFVREPCGQRRTSRVGRAAWFRLHECDMKAAAAPGTP